MTATTLASRSDIRRWVDAVEVALTLLMVTLAALLLLAYGWLAADWQSKPFLGAMISHTLVINDVTSLAGGDWPAHAQGLRAGDHLVRISSAQDALLLSGDYGAARQRLQAFLAGHRTGDVVTLTVERRAEAGDGMAPGCEALPDDAGLRCTATFALSSLPLGDLLIRFGVGYGVGVLLLVFSLGVLLRHWQSSMLRQVAAFCAALAILLSGMFDTHSTFMFSPALWSGAAVVAGTTLMMLGASFPSELDAVWRRPWLRLLPVLPGVVVLLLLAALANPADATDFLRPWEFGAGYLLAGALVFALLLGLRLRRTYSAEVRARCMVAAVGVILTILPMGIWLLGHVLQQWWAGAGVHLRFDFVLTTPFTLIFPLSLVYASSRENLPDSEEVFSQGVTYGMMALALAFGYWLLVTGFSIAGSALVSNSPLLIALVVFVMALLFVPLRTALERQVNRAFFRTRQDYRRRVETLAQQLTEAPDLNAIVKLLRRLLRDTIAPTHVFLFFPSPQTGNFIAHGDETDVRFDRHSPLVRLLSRQHQPLYLEGEQALPPELAPERSRLAVLGTPVLVPLVGQEGVSGILAVGPQQSGESYGYDELRFAQSLADQMALAVERAQVIANLEQKIRELNVLGHVAQAVNFTIEFSDLLELIYAQTNRILHAPNFYIVLRDPNTDELYYAFYSEDDERIHEREQVRWRMSRDLLSDIVRNRQPMRVDNYAVEVNRRSARTWLDNPNLKSWMGVPLNSTSDTLGVMAVGTVDANIRYNDEQLQMLWQIADQAAIAIDKARLFRETQNRARQLTALNEISTRLTTVFQDPDKLLEMITESAVRILDAEAGSLLMVTPNTGELEFKVVTGEEKNELEGKRLPPGTGVVGAVVARGEPLIVNDTLRDPRWFAGIDQDIQFRTNSLLAVPLVTANGVIGVLEILNKKGGGAFVDEDKHILTTFAGQAATAIENARLFQMTDQQLAARVEELNTMQRIDRELNETLGLERVMDITMDWAMRETGARAGALGLVREDPPGVEFVSFYGYADEVIAAQGGQIWPRDRGIIGRVVRSAQGELIANVTHDAGNAPLLPGARCQMAVPLITGGAVTGIMLLESDKENQFSILTLDFAARLAEHASPALGNSQLFVRVERANEERGRFIRFVAHELDNPLTSVRGYMNFLLEGAVGPFNDQQRNFLSIISRNVDRMISLVEDLRIMNKLEVGQLPMEMSSVNFYNIALETLRSMQKQFEDKQQALHFEVPEDLPLAYADPGRMIQIMTNLLSNAHKYTPAEGRITVHAEPANNVWNANGPSRVLHIYVRDTGIGISPEDQARLFTPYFRSTNPQATEQHGTGLGLVIVRGMVEQQRGQIWIDSELGKGSTFHVTIPLASAVPEAMEASATID